MSHVRDSRANFLSRICISHTCATHAHTILRTSKQFLSCVCVNRNTFVITCTTYATYALYLCICFVYRHCCAIMMSTCRIYTFYVYGACVDVIARCFLHVVVCTAVYVIVGIRMLFNYTINEHSQMYAAY